MKGAFPILFLGFIACQNQPVAEDYLLEGTKAFSAGEFRLALEAFQQAEAMGAPFGDALALTQERLLLESARKAIHLNHPHQALALLDSLGTDVWNSELVEELKNRGHLRASNLFYKEGVEHLRMNRHREAAQAFVEALTWDTNSQAAKLGLKKAEKVAQSRHKLGESLHFSGLQNLEAGSANQAHTQFQHAAAFLGDESRSQELLEQLSYDLAAEAKEMAQIYLDSGQVGLAWFHLRDALRLQPKDEKAAAMLSGLEDELIALRRLRSASQHVRAVRSDAIEPLLAEVIALTGDAHAGKVEAIRDNLIQKEANRDYAYGRACEMDNRIVRALHLYKGILESTQGFGFEDIEIRSKNLQARVDKAAQLYEEASHAERNGDKEAAKELFGQVVRAAGDYADALARFRKLQ